MSSPGPFALVLAVTLVVGAPRTAAPQERTARISEEVRVIDTYPFTEANRVPILARDPRLYPYHSFEGYSHAAEPREWTVVHLENDYIEVFVLPEVGGKVWGAIVKETGHEFIYRNEVMKFRNIALRGPWTSGGIEFNFGVIGHTPATATPVDYVLRDNADGSVSVIVGAMDLPSRTHWRVEVRLPADRAYFETRVLWSNPTPLEQPYYNWMTAAAFAQDDLELSIPGRAYLRHSGTEMPWPVDQAGRYLPLYRNNTFEGHKSYHVVGELNDFFGGYYHEDDYGFGHWARYEEMPGQKLWLWALSGEGGVWEDLLTDTDGQYVEFQAGRLFVQYSPDESVNPITQAGFGPLSASRWTETWFPVEGIGGLTDASRDGAMHIGARDGRLSIAINAFGDVSDTLTVWSGDDLIESREIRFTALQPVETVVDLPSQNDFRVRLPALGLDYSSDPSERALARPFSTDPGARESIPEADRLAFEGRELLKARRHGEARRTLEAAAAMEPRHRQALLGLADLAYRRGAFADGLEYANRVLQLDAYDAGANFLAGSMYRALGRTADAHDAFGWAARSVGYRSAAYTQLAELMLRSGELADAERYARLAIDFDRHGVPAWQVLAIVGRRRGEAGRALAQEALRELLGVDPLHHFALAEGYLAEPGSAAGQALTAAMRGEYPGQTLLELSIGYANRGLTDDARALLALEVGTDAHLVRRAWRAWLDRDAAELADAADPAFAFPFRTESLPVLAWAAEQSGTWVWRYLLALNLWAVDRRAEAASHLAQLGDLPDFAPLYVARASLSSELEGADPTPDLERAVALDPGDRLLHVELIRHHQDRGRWGDAVAVSTPARQRFPDDFNLDLLHAKALIHLGRADGAAAILAGTRVLPSENSRESHLLHEQAHTLMALDAIDVGGFTEAKGHLETALEWPETLGQGRPYESEERLVRFLLGRVESRLGNADEARAAFQSVVASSAAPSTPAATDPAAPTAGDARAALTPKDLLAISALHALGRAAELDAWSRAGSTRSGVARFAANLARALTDEGADPAEAVLRLAPSNEGLFADLDGQMLLRALTVQD
jgi:tetratricopeptide (TPR) repeat protein